MTDKKNKREKTIKITLSLDDEMESGKKAVTEKKSAFLDASALLRLANLEEREGKRRTEYGETPVRLLAFQEESHREKIIALLRDNYPETAWKLLPLLRKFGAHERAEVRRKAAEAAGMLMRELDFERVKSEVIVPWALSNSLAVNLNVGLALHEAAQDERFAANIKALFKHWSSIENLNYAWTALLSCVPFCEIWPDEVLDLIERSFKHQRIELLALVFFVCRELLQKSHGKKLIPRLADWIKSGKEKNHYRLAASSIFIETVEFSEIARAAALTDNAVEIFLIGLGDRSIDNAGVYRELFLEKLKDWLGGAQNGKKDAEKARSFFLKLYARSDERGKQRLEYHIRKWARDKKTESAQIFQNLSRELSPE